jgi:hypothetical protein
VKYFKKYTKDLKSKKLTFEILRNEIIPNSISDEEKKELIIELSKEEFIQCINDNQK